MNLNANGGSLPAVSAACRTQSPGPSDRPWPPVLIFDDEAERISSLLPRTKGANRFHRFLQALLKPTEPVAVAHDPRKITPKKLPFPNCLESHSGEPSRDRAETTVTKV